MGRKRKYIPTDKDRRLVEHLSGLGVPVKSIAALIGDESISVGTLYNNFRSELDSGKAKMHTKACQILASQIEHDKTLLIFYLKTQCGWSEVSKIEHTGTDGGPMRVKVEIVDVNGAKIKSNVKRS